MEDSILSMSDNEGDSDTPLKEVVQLCSMLAGKGMQISICTHNCFQGWVGRKWAERFPKCSLPFVVREVVGEESDNVRCNNCPLTPNV